MGDSKHRLLTSSDLITLLLVVVVVLYLMPAGDRLKFRQVVAELGRAFGRAEPAASTGVGVPRLEELPVEEPPQQPNVGLPHRERVISSFGSGSAEVPPDMALLLEELAKELAALPDQVRLEGYSDNVPILNGAYRSNQELSVARAQQVSAFLEQRGVSRERMVVVGFGERNPVAPNDTPEGRARNRRVDVVLLPFPERMQELGSRPE